MITIIRKSILLFIGSIIIYSFVLFFRNDDANSINRFLIDSDSTFLNNNTIERILEDKNIDVAIHLAGRVYPDKNSLKEFEKSNF